MNRKMIDLFICPECKHEDSSYLPMFKGQVKECTNCKTDQVINTIEVPFGDYMTLKEYNDLVEHILNNHRWGKRGGKNIKYITNRFDTRTAEIFYVKLDNVEFAKVNENRHRNLKDWIMEYLNKSK